MLLFLIFPLISFAAADSVAVYHRPEKVVVLVNEYGQRGRLQAMLDAWPAGKDLFWEVAEFYVRCARGTEGVTCTFRLLPTGNARFSVKESFWEGFGPSGDFSLVFEGSRGHRLEFGSTGGRISFRTRRP